MAHLSDNQMTSAIVQHLKSGGIFDQFRRDCLSDADTKPSFQNLLQRVEGYVSKFLSQQRWHQSLNKNQLRERLRAQINESGMLKYGIEHLVDQAVNPKINSLFLPQIECVVKDFLGISDHIIQDNIKEEMVKEDNSLPVPLSHIKKEPNDDNVRDEPQPMDIETDSECSRDGLIVNVKNESIHSEIDSDNHYVDWPTPPQPEMLTPDRNDDTRNTFNDNSQSEDVKPYSKSVDETSTTQEEDLNTTSSDLTNYKVKLNLKKEVKHRTIKKENTKVEDLSDVSSVHTSDLSDFDDEISLSSNDDAEDSKKKKISLKVVKEITSREQSKESSVKRDTSNETSIEGDYSAKQSKIDKKRIRKVNPKYASNDFSSIFSEKRMHTLGSKDVNEEESENSNNSLHLSEKSKLSKSSENQTNESKIRKRRSSNNSDNDIKESDDSNQKSSKLSMITEELPADSRCSSRASVESSSYSETTQDSVSSQMKSSKRRASKSRNESQTQRYEASDLYKPRPMISSSARSTRTRRPTTPDSTLQVPVNTRTATEGTDNFVIHDLSK